MMKRLLSIATGIVAGAVLGGTPPCAAQPGPPSQSVSLADAVRITLERSPAVADAREEIARRTGSQREAVGAFDMVFRARPSLEHREGYLEPASYGREAQRRTALEEAAKAFTTVRKELEVNVANNRGELPPCPSGLTRLTVTIEGQELPVPMCVPLQVNPLADQPDIDLYQAAQDANQWLPGQRALDPGAMLAFQNELAKVMGMQVSTLTEDLRQRNLEYVRNVYRIALETETWLWLSLARLGVFPTYEIRKSAVLDLSLTKPLRRGTMLQARLNLEGVEDNFRGKPLDPRFGGKVDNPNTFLTDFSLAFNQPLRRGLGRVSVEAPLRAAGHNLDAGLRQYEFAVSQATLGSVLSYFDLVAAESSMGLLAQSLETQRRIRDATVKLVAAGDMARSEITRIDARIADVQASIATSQEQVIAARLGLADRMGLSVKDLGPDFSSIQRFVESPAPIDLDGPARQASERRADFLAANDLRSSARVLLDAARADARSKLDLSVSAGMASDYFSPYFRVLKDEFVRVATEPRESPVDYFHPRGILRSFQSNLQPQAFVKLTWELPFGNNARLGRLAQAQATLRRSEIQTTDLARVIDENVIEQAASVRRARQELERWREAIAQYEASWTSAEKLRIAGSLSLIDTLVTEQDLTSARLQFIQTQRDFATAVARFRFETGTLVDFRNATPVVADLSGLVTGR